MTSNFKKSIFEHRRKKLLSSLPDSSVVVIPNSKHQIRSNDVEYKFKPDTDFYYLTGFEEPNSVCILKKEKKDFSFILFLEPKDKDKEIWTGKRTGLEKAKSQFGADESYPFSHFNEKLKSILINFENIYYPLGKDPKLDSRITTIVGDLKRLNRSGLKSPKRILDHRDIIHRMRFIKDSNEIGSMRKAAEISRFAHIEAMKLARPGIHEYELEAIIEYHFRKNGASGPSYPTIVGSGENCTILHYIENSKRIKDGDLILIDAGCEYENYASDVTRTFPAGKKFSSEQKDLYEIVLESQLKALGEIKPGKTFIDAHNKAVKVIVEGLKYVGLLKGSTEKIIKNGDYKKFYMHKTGHWLGLDVHDAGPYVDEKGKSIKLKPGMVTTLEPGIYTSNSSDLPIRFRGIGIRIEDDVLITSRGHDVLTKGTPKTVKEIENLRS
jgi:Xaa-Pro aminopeptidase